MTCSECGHPMDAANAWFHPGTGDTICDLCHRAAHLQRAALTASQGLVR